MWQNKEIKKSTQIFDKWTLVFAKNDYIFAASEDKEVVELDLNLDVVKKFTGRNSQPFTIDANENYLVVGYKSGLVDVHSRKELVGNETHQKLLVSNAI